jgi:hypothetical protein
MFRKVAEEIMLRPPFSPDLLSRRRLDFVEVVARVMPGELDRPGDRPFLLAHADRAPVGPVLHVVAREKPSLEVLVLRRDLDDFGELPVRIEGEIADGQILELLAIPDEVAGVGLFRPGTPAEKDSRIRGARVVRVDENPFPLVGVPVLLGRLEVIVLEGFVPGFVDDRNRSAHAALLCFVAPFGCVHMGIITCRPGNRRPNSRKIFKFS